MSIVPLPHSAQQRRCTRGHTPQSTDAKVLSYSTVQISDFRACYILYIVYITYIQYSQVSSRNLKNLFLCAKRAAAKQITPLCSSPDRLSKAFTLCITIQRRSFFSSYPLIISAHRFNRPVGCRACLDARLLRAGVDNTSSAQINRHMAAVVNNITGLGLGIAHLTARTSLLI